MVVRTGGEVLVASSQAAGVRHIFGIPGVQLDNLVDPLHDADDLQLVARAQRAGDHLHGRRLRALDRRGRCRHDGARARRAQRAGRSRDRLRLLVPCPPARRTARLRRDRSRARCSARDPRPVRHSRLAQQVERVGALARPDPPAGRAGVRRAAVRATSSGRARAATRRPRRQDRRRALVVRASDSPRPSTRPRSRAAAALLGGSTAAGHPCRRWRARLGGESRAGRACRAAAGAGRRHRQRARRHLGPPPARPSTRSRWPGSRTTPTWCWPSAPASSRPSASASTWVAPGSCWSTPTATTSAGPRLPDAHRSRRCQGRPRGPGRRARGAPP